MDKRKKIIIIVLIILAVVLGVASILISQYLQLNPQSGNIGANNTIPATKEMYPEINAAFTQSCSNLFDQDGIALYSLSTFTDVKDIRITSVTSYPVASSLGCTVNLSNDEKLEIAITTYNSSDTIPQLDNLIEDTTSVLMDTVFDIATYPASTTFYFGEAKDSASDCMTVLFSKLNDYKYISVRYKNFDKSCIDLVELNDQISYIITKSADSLTAGIKQ